MVRCRKLRIFASLLPAIAVLLAVPIAAEPISNSEELRKLISGNSLYGRYNGVEFRQQMREDGVLLVNVKGEKAVRKARWFINDSAQYCEEWPDHNSCFGIGYGDGDILEVLPQTPAQIESHLYRGAIPLGFAD
jgi:hypothetical protein